jgi:PAP2 superfamily
MRFKSVASLAVTVVTALAMSLLMPSAMATTRAGGPHASGPPDVSIVNWDSVAMQAFTAAALPPPDGHVIFAYTAIAMYDAVVAIEGGYQPFAVDLDAPADASPEAAVATAAHAVLVHYLPAQQATIFDPAYGAALAAIPNGPAKVAGMAVGDTVAAQLIALRAGDGFRVSVPYTPPSPPIPGVWIPTAPTPPIGTYMKGMQPFALKSADQFRPDGPPALTSKQWAEDYNEVKEIGSSTSTTRTADQTVAARFWAEPPVQQAHGALRMFILDHGLDVVRAARLEAMEGVTFADGLIACFDAKYTYTFWRPVTAIRAGDTDGNEATVGNPTWSPLIGTPNHPEYPSAHSCITPAGGRVLARFMGSDHIALTVPSLTGLGARYFDKTQDLEYEVMNARIWGGIHYRTAVEDGSQVGKRVADWILAHNFQYTPS